MVCCRYVCSVVLTTVDSTSYHFTSIVPVLSIDRLHFLNEVTLSPVPCHHLQIVNSALESQRHARQGQSDTVRQSLVVLLGSVAKHLDPEDPQVPEVSPHDAYPHVVCCNTNPNYKMKYRHCPSNAPVRTHTTRVYVCMYVCVYVCERGYICAQTDKNTNLQQPGYRPTSCDTVDTVGDCARCGWQLHLPADQGGQASRARDPRASTRPTSGRSEIWRSSWCRVRCPALL